MRNSYKTVHKLVRYRLKASPEFPEIAQQQANISEKLGYSPMWGYVAGIHDYPRIRNKHDKSVAKALPT